MFDIALEWSNELWRGDWVLADGALKSDSDLATSVMISLFSDRTALPDDVLPYPESTIRGWWADTYRTYAIGSRLWLLWREKQTEITRRRAEEYAREALAWMIVAGVARSVSVQAAWVSQGFLDMLIEIFAPSGERKVWRYPLAWGQLG